ncbi:MAG: DUF6457 domain-containing protein [Patulibacter sp.]
MADAHDTTTLEGWLAAFADATGTAAPSDDEVAQLLDLARHAAHRAVRPTAPLACFLAGRSGRPVAELLALVEADPRLHAAD